MSFSGSCILSKIPVHSGTKIVMFPIAKNPNKFKEEMVTLRDVDSLYMPTMLPIIGEYNDYGSITNIVEDENTKFLEKYYKKPIEDIIRTIDSNRNIFDSYGKIPKIWGIKVEEKNSLNSFKRLGFQLKINDEGNQYLYNKEFDLSLFNKNPSKEFVIEPNYTLTHTKKAIITEVDKVLFEKVGLAMPEDKLISIDVNLPNLISDRTLQNIVHQKLGIILGLKNQEDSKLLTSLYKMKTTFANKEIYDRVSKAKYREYKEVEENNNSIENDNIKMIHLFRWGFDIKEDKNFNFKAYLENKKITLFKDNIEVNFSPWSVEIVKQHSNQQISNIKNFISTFNMITKGDKIDISSIEDIKGSKAYVNEAISNIREIVLMATKNNLNEKTLNEVKNKLLNDLDQIFKELFGDKANEIYKDHILSLILTENRDNNLINSFFDKLDDFRNFQHIMIASNTIFLPSLGGYQDGAIEVNRYLNKITNEMLNPNDDLEHELEN